MKIMHFIMDKHLTSFILIIISALLLCGCGNSNINKSLRSIESMLDDQPAEALSILDDIDPESINCKSLKMRYNLLYSIALAKNHLDDGRFVDEMESAVEWYDRFGYKNYELKARYYYGDQLRGSGRLEEAAVQFMQSEKEAISQDDWFLAGMSARSLYYVFAKTHNYPEELSSIKRAVDYFKLAGKEPHEDDARIKLALAFYDNSDLIKADSVFNSAIRIATIKKDTVRLRSALANSVDVFLVSEPYQPDSAICRLERAEALGYKPNSRGLATYSLSKALMMRKVESDNYLHAAYAASRSEAEKAFVINREYQIRIAEGDDQKAYPLLCELYEYVDSVAVKTLEQSVVKAQNSYLESVNDLLKKQKSISRMIALLLVLLILTFLFAAWLLFKRNKEQHRLAEEEMRLETDRFRLACDELGAMGFESIDRISEAYYYPHSQIKAAMLNAYESEIARFQTQEFQNRLIENIDKKYNGVITKLKEQMPSLTRNRILLFAYLVMGLSYTTIKVIMGSRSRQNIYDMRWQLIAAIKKENPADMDLFLSYLPNHPTRR